MKPLIICTLILLLLTGCATQDRRMDWMEQRLGAVEKRSSEIENSQQELSNRYDHQSRMYQQALQELREQIATLYAANEKHRQEVMQLVGKLEEAEFQLQRRAQLTPDGDTLARANQQRLARIEEVLKLAPLVSLPRQPEEAVRKPEIPAETELYAAAKQAFDRGEMSAAREGFQQLLKHYPASANADNAIFWIGETHYREKWFEKAILEYQKVIEKYPHGSKVQAAMLKQGLAFFNLGDKTNARLILRRLVDSHPEASESRIARQKLQEM